MKAKPKDEDKADVGADAMDVDGEAEPSGFNSDEDRVYIEGSCLLSSNFTKKFLIYGLFSLLSPSFRVETEGHESEGTPCPPSEKTCAHTHRRPSCSIIFSPVLHSMYILLADSSHFIIVYKLILQASGFGPRAP